MKEEIFKDIEGYEGLYQISNLGNVRSLGRWVNSKGGGKRFLKGIILKPMKDKDGYLYVGLCKKSKYKCCKVHRLVAQAFIPNPFNLPQINHIDEDKTNNIVSNIEWCTCNYNINYGTHNKRSAESKSKKPIQLTLDYKLIKEWASTRECGRNGFSHGVVSACCNNKYGKEGNVYKGYRWMYAEDYYKLFAA